MLAIMGMKLNPKGAPKDETTEPASRDIANAQAALAQMTVPRIRTRIPATESQPSTGKTRVADPSKKSAQQQEAGRR